MKGANVGISPKTIAKAGGTGWPGLDVSLGIKLPGSRQFIQQGVCEVNTFTGAANIKTIWGPAQDTAGSPVGPNEYIFSTTADITRMSCETIGNNQNIEIVGLDTDLHLVVQTLALDGQTVVPLATPLRAIFLAANRGSTVLTGIVYVYTDNGGVTDGVPDTADSVRATINGENQSRMAQFTSADNNQFVTLITAFNFSVVGGTGSTREVTGSISFQRENQIKTQAIPWGVSAGNGPTFYNLPAPLVVTKRTNVTMDLNSADGNGMGVSGGLIFLFVPFNLVSDDILALSNG